MVATAQDLARIRGRHWAARPLPEPPRTRHASRWAIEPIDMIGRQLEEWLRELTVGNTLEGD